MTRHAAHGRKAAENRPASRLKGPAGVALGALVLAVAQGPVLADAAAAQSRSGIFINNDVLNNLGPGPDAAQVAPLSPTPLTPGGPAPSYQYPAPGVQAAPAYQAPAYQAPAAQAGSGGLTFQPHGSGNFVVTRPGTLLFPPLEAPSSTLAPGFGGSVDNQAARTEAFNNAFAEGPEPSSQLLIPLDNGGGTAVATSGIAGSGGSDSVTINMGALPPADPNAQPVDAPRLTLVQPPMPAPQPAPRKPEVPAEMLAEIDLAPIDNGPAELAPEFMTPAPTEVADLPPVAETPEPAMPAESADSTMTADETPAPALAEAPAPLLEPEPAAESMPASPGRSEAPSSADVPAPVTLAETPSAPTPAPETAPAAAPVSLLPAGSSGDAARAAPAPEPMPAPAAPPSGLQTASLTVEGVEDMTFLFEGDSAELSASVQTELRSLADTMRTNEEWIQVLGFASGPQGAPTGTTDQARKLALSRALKVRSFLIDAGIASARIQVRSLGNRAEGGPANRVDIKPIGS